MIRMVAFVPQPPLLVPQLGVGRVAETAALRAAALAVTARLADAAGHWIVVATDPAGRRSVDRPPSGTFRGYGVDVRVSLAPDAPVEAGADLPLPLLIAGWLRGQSAPDVSALAELVPPDLPVEQCRQVGATLARTAGDQPIGLLVVGDGATTHTEQITGHRDDRATPFDGAVAAALADADTAGLLALDAGLGIELNAAGRAAWQVAAGAVESTGGAWHGELTYSDAPYGVAYHVAAWDAAIG